jgi:hypothetical protein
MDDVARLPAGDRADLFRATAARCRLTAAIIEKDFWVCWTRLRPARSARRPAVQGRHLAVKGLPGHRQVLRGCGFIL